MKDWKSSMAGVLAFLIATFTVVTAFLAPYLLMAPSSDQALLAKISAGLVLGTSLARVWVGLITQNADATAVAQALGAPTGSLASVPTPATLATTPLITVAKVVVLLIVLGTACSVLTGCTDWERTTYQTLSASKAVIDQAQTDYEARRIAKTPAAFAAINEAKATQTLAVQSMETYEEIKAAKGTQSALTAQQAIVQAVLDRLPVLIAAIKGMVPANELQPHAMLRWNLPLAA